MTYVPPYLENWKTIAQECPYRASVSGNVSWKFHPSPDLIDAEKVSPGGRLLLAFRSKEVRDYFVEGYLDQGVKVEEDWCVRATKPEPAVKVVDAVPNFEEASAAIVRARAAYQAADDVISELFLKDIKSLIAQGKTTDALKIVVSIHGDCVSRTLGISALMDAGHDFDANSVGQTEALPLTAERAVALTDWLKARKANRKAEDVLGKIVNTKLSEIMETKGRAPAIEFAEALPPSMVKVFAIDRARHGKAIEPVELDEDDAPSGPRI
ncbi:hypothetical protein [Rhizobium sp. MHM7A]|uniref:hypothetical protein n=1 Tax=Rhizobium sp. MHM7A TaxID=2583233 RepID=UPI0011065C4F|nr:hypothetical protein [Rhizobium sp. MHM7A]TLX16381.1 hypothetical protein FFR93_03345 [Rhizobium sp. MHM7A]